MSNKLTDMAIEILLIEKDLPFRFDYGEKISPTVDDFELHTFEQIWGSTALGFGGMGGQAITTARTYVLIPRLCNQNCFVYFNGKFAYAVPYSDILMKDIRSQNMASVAKSCKYNKTAKE